MAAVTVAVALCLNLLGFISIMWHGQRWWLGILWLCLGAIIAALFARLLVVHLLIV